MKSAELYIEPSSVGVSAVFSPEDGNRFSLRKVVSCSEYLTMGKVLNTWLTSSDLLRIVVTALHDDSSWGKSHM